jgi:hypothetical protein
MRNMEIERNKQLKKAYGYCKSQNAINEKNYFTEQYNYASAHGKTVPKSVATISPSLPYVLTACLT